MTANVLDISHLTLSIEHKTILQDIDLTIGAGETVALIGEYRVAPASPLEPNAFWDCSRSGAASHPRAALTFWESLFPLKTMPGCAAGGDAQSA